MAIGIASPGYGNVIQVVGRDPSNSAPGSHAGSMRGPSPTALETVSAGWRQPSSAPVVLAGQTLPMSVQPPQVIGSRPGTGASLGVRLVPPSRDGSIGAGSAASGPFTLPPSEPSPPRLISAPGTLSPAGGGLRQPGRPLSGDSAYGATTGFIVASSSGTGIVLPAGQPVAGQLAAGQLAAGQMAAAQLAAPSTFVQRPAATAVASTDAQLRALFDTADTTRSGALEWNTGEVQNFGKAVLDTFGRESDGDATQTLLYNLYDDADRDCNGKMSLAESLSFAQKVLQSSSAPSRTGKPLQPPLQAPSTFDTNRSAMSTVYDTRTSAYTRPIPISEYGVDKTALGSSSALESSVHKSLGTSEEDAATIRRLEESMRQQEEEFSAVADENRQLREMVEQLQNRVTESQQQQVSSFDPIVQNLQNELDQYKQQCFELQRMNEDLQARASTQQSQEHLSEQIARAHQEKFNLEDTVRQLQAQLDAGGRQRSSDQLDQYIAGMEDHERKLNEDIQRLEAENAQLRMQGQGGDAGDAQPRKKKFICC